MANKNITDGQIREAAYLFWLNEGQPEGRDQDHWLRAVDALTKPVAKAKAAKPVAKKAKAAKAPAKRAAKPKAKPATKAKAASK